ncbi:hypothetical protein EJB05_11365, partial [Eragrostis curvula]
MAADANARIVCHFYHPQHLVASYSYSEASTCSCAACECIVTGAGYRCEECDFNIHEACYQGLPLSATFDKHKEHDFTLTLLGSSWRCAVCNESSHAGRYMYLCQPCNYGVHPRCTTLLAERGRRRGRTRRAIMVGLRIGVFGFRVADLMSTGGAMSSVLDVVDVAIGNM